MRDFIAAEIAEAADSQVTRAEGRVSVLVEFDAEDRRVGSGAAAEIVGDHCEGTAVEIAGKSARQNVDRNGVGLIDHWVEKSNFSRRASFAQILPHSLDDVGEAFAGRGFPFGGKSHAQMVNFPTGLSLSHFDDLHQNAPRQFFHREFFVLSLDVTHPHIASRGKPPLEATQPAFLPFVELGHFHCLGANMKNGIVFIGHVNEIEIGTEVLEVDLLLVQLQADGGASGTVAARSATICGAPIVSVATISHLGTVMRRTVTRTGYSWALPPWSFKTTRPLSCLAPSPARCNRSVSIMKRMTVCPSFGSVPMVSP